MHKPTYVQRYPTWSSANAHREAITTHTFGPPSFKGKLEQKFQNGSPKYYTYSIKATTNHAQRHPSQFKQQSVIDYQFFRVSNAMTTKQHVNSAGSGGEGYEFTLQQTRPYEDHRCYRPKFPRPYISIEVLNSDENRSHIVKSTKQSKTKCL